MERTDWCQCSSLFGRTGGLIRSIGNSCRWVYCQWTSQRYQGANFLKASRQSPQALDDGYTLLLPSLLCLLSRTCVHTEPSRRTSHTHYIYMYCPIHMDFSLSEWSLSLCTISQHILFALDHYIRRTLISLCCQYFPIIAQKERLILAYTYQDRGPGILCRTMSNNRFHRTP